MQLRYITCSDPREHVKISDLMDLLQVSPIAEVAVQAHPSKMSFGMPRQIWFDNVCCHLYNSPKPLNFAVHVNLDFCKSFVNGKIPDELVEPFNMEYAPGIPLIRRWQLNMPRDVAENFPTDTVAKTIAQNPDKEFIFQYNANNASAIKSLYNTGVKFSVLFDESGGRGIDTDTINPPVFDDRPNGYSGGISPENVGQKLDKIKAVAPNRHDIWIDAEGKLKNAENKFDVARARTYIQNAMKHR